MKGSHVELLPEPVADDAVDTMNLNDAGPVFGHDEEIDAELDKSTEHREEDLVMAVQPAPDAERRIQLSWKIVDRVLDLLLWKRKTRGLKKALPAIRGKRLTKRVETSDEEDEEVGDIEQQLDVNTLDERKRAYEDGEQPSDWATETIGDFERREKRKLNEGDIELVAWAFFKWHGLGYEEG